MLEPACTIKNNWGGISGRFDGVFCTVYLLLGFSIKPPEVYPSAWSRKGWWSVGFFLLEFVEAKAFSQPYNCAIRSLGILLSWLSDERQRINFLPGTLSPGTRYVPGRI